MQSGKFAVADAEKTFRALLAEQSLIVRSLTPVQGLTAMIDFFTTWEPGGVEPESDGDGLLFQWGTYDWSASGTAQFELNLTRQFILPERDDEYEDDDDSEEGDDDDDAGDPIGDEDDDDEFGEGIFQLSLTFGYPANDVTAALGSGDAWYFAPVDESDVRSAILDSAVTASATNLGSPTVRLEYSPV